MIWSTSRRGFIKAAGISTIGALAPRSARAATFSIRCTNGNYYSRLTGSFPAGNAYTVCGWMRVKAPGGTTGVFMLVLSNANGTGFGSLTLTRPSAVAVPIEMFTRSGVTDFGGIDAGFNTWFFMAMAQSGTGANTVTGWYARVDDVGFTKRQISGDSFTPAAFAVGPTANATDFFDGNVAAVKVWSAVLNDTEIAAERFAYAPQRLRNLNGWYPLDSLSGVDGSGNGNHLSAVGSPTSEDGPPVIGAAPSLGSLGRVRMRY